MKSAPGGVTITILGKELMVACLEDERPALMAAARNLDQRIKPLHLTDRDKKDLVAFLNAPSGEGWQNITAPEKFPE